MFYGEIIAKPFRQIRREKKDLGNKLKIEIQRRNGRRKDVYKDHGIPPSNPDAQIQIALRKIIEQNRDSHSL